MAYSETVMDHFTNPRNTGELDPADGIGEAGNARCGDQMRITLRIRNGVIEDVKFLTLGCGAAIASSSMATEMIKGRPLREAAKLTDRAVAEALGGLPPAKLHCSLLAERAIKLALADYCTRRGLDPAGILGEPLPACPCGCETCPPT